jgi:hypothetical protein
MACQVLLRGIPHVLECVILMSQILHFPWFYTTLRWSLQKYKIGVLLYSHLIWYHATSSVQIPWLNELQTNESSD